MSLFCLQYTNFKGKKHKTHRSITVVLAYVANKYLTSYFMKILNGNSFPTVVGIIKLHLSEM